MNYLILLGGYAKQLLPRINMAASQKDLPEVFSLQNQLNTDYRVITHFKWMPPFITLEVIYHPGKEDEVNLGKF